jgi:hypothetical protein
MTNPLLLSQDLDLTLDAAAALGEISIKPSGGSRTVSA